MCKFYTTYACGHPVTFKHAATFQKHDRTASYLVKDGDEYTPRYIRCSYGALSVESNWHVPAGSHFCGITSKESQLESQCPDCITSRMNDAAAKSHAEATRDIVLPSNYRGSSASRGSRASRASIASIVSLSKGLMKKLVRKK